jgi:nucleoside-diphosphate-sugar epimerase
MRVFVTGSTGFIGSAVVQELIKAGHQVLGLARSDAGARFHGVAEEGVPFRDIAEVIGRRLNVPVVAKSPEETAKHFGWFAHFAAIDNPASSRLTQERLGWRPVQTGLIPDLDGEHYFKS